MCRSIVFHSFCAGYNRRPRCKITLPGALGFTGGMIEGADKQKSETGRRGGHEIAMGTDKVIILHPRLSKIIILDIFLIVICISLPGTYLASVFSFCPFKLSHTLNSGKFF